MAQHHAGALTPAFGLPQRSDLNILRDGKGVIPLRKWVVIAIAAIAALVPAVASANIIWDGPK